MSVKGVSRVKQVKWVCEKRLTWIGWEGVRPRNGDGALVVPAVESLWGSAEEQARGRTGRQRICDGRNRNFAGSASDFERLTMNGTRIAAKNKERPETPSF